MGPRDPEDIRRAGLATLAPPPERHAAYHALFDMHFLGERDAGLAEGEEEDVVRVQEDRRGADEPVSADESNESGQAATRAEALVERRFGRRRRRRSLAPPGARSRAAPAEAA